MPYTSGERRNGEMMLPLLVLVLAIVFSSSAVAATSNAVERCHRAGRLLDEIMAAPDTALPQELFTKAHCVALIPGVKKIGFGFGGKYGKGVLSCRTAGRTGWSGPSTVRLEGGSFGLQIGASSTDVILLIMNEAGAKKLLSSKFTLGADAGVAAGPVGRSAQVHTDAQMRAKILSYSRSRGLFAGISLEGATLRPDHDADEQIYGHEVSPLQILSGQIPTPELVAALPAKLGKYSRMAAEAARPKKVEQAKAPPGPPADGIIKITSEPAYAEVDIDSDPNGLTPRAKALRPGEYAITVRKKGFEPWSRSVTVKEGETLALHAELAALPAVASEDSTQQAKRRRPENARIRIEPVR